MSMLSANKCVLGLFTFCVYYLTPIHAHTHTRTERERGRQVRCVVCRLFHFFNGSFAQPSSFFGCPPSPNPTQSFLFFSFHFALRCEPSLTLKLTHPENVKSVSAFFGFCFVFSSFLFFGNKFNDFLKPKFLCCVVSVSVLGPGASHFFWVLLRCFFGFLLLFSFFLYVRFHCPSSLPSSSGSSRTSINK